MPVTFPGTKIPQIQKKRQSRRLMQTLTCYFFQALIFPRYQEKTKKVNANPYWLHFQALKFSRVKQKTEKAKISPHFLHFQALKFPRYKENTKKANINPYQLHFQALKIPPIQRKDEKGWHKPLPVAFPSTTNSPDSKKRQGRLTQTPTCCISRCAPPQGQWCRSAMPHGPESQRGTWWWVVPCLQQARSWTGHLYTSAVFPAERKQMMLPYQMPDKWTRHFHAFTAELIKRHFALLVHLFSENSLEEKFNQPE